MHMKSRIFLYAADFDPNLRVLFRSCRCRPISTSNVGHTASLPVIGVLELYIGTPDTGLHLLGHMGKKDTT